jgi:hypothetical protein
MSKRSQSKIDTTPEAMPEWNVSDLEYVKPGDLADDERREAFYETLRTVGQGVTLALVVGRIAHKDAGGAGATGRDYAAKVGLDPSRVSRIDTYAAAYRRGIKPHGRHAKVWTLLITSNATGVRKVAEDKTATQADVIAAIRAAYDKQHAPKVDAPDPGEDDSDGGKRVARPGGDEVETFGNVLRDMQAILKRLQDAGPPRAGEVGKAQNVVAAMGEHLATLAVGLDAEVTSAA